MSTHTVTATREGTWWVVDCGEHGTTQARNLTEARAAAVDLIAIVLDVPVEDVDVDLRAKLDGEAGELVATASAMVPLLEWLQQETAATSRAAVAELAAAGLSGRDIAIVLGVSPQRVSQLAAGAGRTGSLEPSLVEQVLRRFLEHVESQPRGLLVDRLARSAVSVTSEARTAADRDEQRVAV